MEDLIRKSWWRCQSCCSLVCVSWILQLGWRSAVVVVWFFSAESCASFGSIPSLFGGVLLCRWRGLWCVVFCFP